MIMKRRIISLLVPCFMFLGFLFSGCESKKDDSFKVTYDYNFDYDVSGSFKDYKKTQTINQGRWIEGMPKPYGASSELFDGWYIKGTTKKINEYDSIGGNVTLVAKWIEEPYGLYNEENRLVARWDDIVENPHGFDYQGKVVVVPPVIEDSEEEALKDNGFANVYYVKDVRNYSYEILGNNLQNIIVSKDNNFYSSVDGVLFNKDRTILHHYPYLKTGSTYVVPESVEKIPVFDAMFLNTIKIGKNVNRIYDNPFQHLENLKEIIVSNDNPYFTTVDGVLYNKDRSSLIAYPRAKEGSAFSIPASVDTIEYFAFYGNRNLVNITIPGTVKEISYRLSNYTGSWGFSFANMDSLVSVIISDGVEYIGPENFKNNPKLESLIIPDSVVYIGAQLIDDCSEDLVVELPANSEWSLDGKSVAVDASGLNVTFEGATMTVTELLKVYNDDGLLRV